MTAGPSTRPARPRRAGLVINPAAWTNRERPGFRRALGGAFAPLGEVVETDDPTLLPGLLGRWCAEGFDLVAVAGGDGTVHTVVNALLCAWAGPLPPLMLLHGGTMGVTARSACPGAPLRQVTAVGRARTLGEPLPLRRIQTLRVGGRVAFNFGVGLFADLPAELERRGERGPAAVRDLGLRTLASALVGGALATRALQGWHGEALRDGRRLASGRIAGLYATGLDGAAPLHMRGFDAAERPPGAFRVVSIDATRAELIQGLVPFALGWRRGVAPGVRVEAAHQLELRPVGLSRHVTDGEIHVGDEALVIEAGPMLEVVGR